MGLVSGATRADRPLGLRFLAVVGLAVLASGCFEQTEALFGLNARIDEDASPDERSAAYAIIERHGVSVAITLEDPYWWLMSDIPSSNCPLLREELAAHPAVVRVTECTKQP